MHIFKSSKSHFSSSWLQIIFTCWASVTDATVSRTDVAGVDCRPVPSLSLSFVAEFHYPKQQHLQPTEAPQSCFSFRMERPERLLCLPAQYEPCNPRRHMNRRSPIALQNALQQVSLCMFLPKAATLIEFASDRLHHSARREQLPKMGPLPLGPRSLHSWEQVHAEFMWQMWESEDAVETVLAPARATRDIVYHFISYHIWYVHMYHGLLKSSSSRA